MYPVPFLTGYLPVFIICQIVLQLVPALAHDFIGKCIGADTEKGCIVG